MGAVSLLIKYSTFSNKGRGRALEVPRRISQDYFEVTQWPTENPTQNQASEKLKRPLRCLSACERIRTQRQCNKEWSLSLACCTFCGPQGSWMSDLHSSCELEKAYARIHLDLFEGDEKAAKFFFSWLLVDRKMKLYYESQFGQGVKVLFKTHPKLRLPC